MTTIVAPASAVNLDGTDDDVHHHHETPPAVPVGGIVRSLCGHVHRRRSTVVATYPCCPMCNTLARRKGEPCPYEIGQIE